MRRSVLDGVAFGAALGGIAYLGFAWLRVRGFRRRVPERPGELPPVTLLKPLCGDEEGLYENLCSFCEQDYPRYDVVLGLRGASDPAAEVAQRIAARYPERVRLVIGNGEVPTGNPKVANLARMAHVAYGSILVMADADMRVSPEYLQTIVAPFGDSRVGAVTCLYAGSPAGGTASELAAMFINEQFAPSVLVASALEPLRYCFGATIAVRRDVLESIGGFAALANHVADDHLIGALVSQRGLRVELSRYVVDNIVAEPNLRSMWLRELRWSRTIRSVRPLGHAFSVLTFGLPLTIVAAMTGRNRRLGLALVAVAAALRIALRNETSAAFGVPKAGSPFLIPLRDAISVAVWAAAFLDRGVVWRGQRLELDPEGSILAG